jgi:hypothetical protein
MLIINQISRVVLKVDAKQYSNLCIPKRLKAEMIVNAKGLRKSVYKSYNTALDDRQGSD